MSAASRRAFARSDLARGIAILAMIAFHFCFDLSYWQLASFNMLGDWRWIWSRNLIVTAFLAIMGISLVLGHDHSTLPFLASTRSAWGGGAGHLAHLPG